MQITEQIIQRIARQVFNQMFPSSLRQSGAIISGSGSSVQYAVEAGHAASADAASSVPWTGVSGRPTKLSDFTNDEGYITGVSWDDVEDKPTTFTPPLATSSVRGGIKIGFTTSEEDQNYAVLLSNEKAYVNVPWENSWRPVQDNLVTDSGTDCLSARQGMLLNSYIQTIADYFDSDGNAKSALKLTTVSKTAWGQTYWTSGGVPDSISGDMSSVGNISFAATGKNIGGIAYFDTTNSRLGIGTSSPSYTLHVNGTAYASTALAHGDISIGNTNEINSTSNLYLQYRETGHVVMCIGGGNVGIGTSSPSQALHVVGAIYCTSGFTFLSDIRKKDVITYQWAPALSAIAEAPIIRYTLKDDKEKRERIGSVAQYWQQITPEAVTEAHDGTLSMDYGSIALTSVIALAREVKQLKAQVARLTQQRNG